MRTCTRRFGIAGSQIERCPADRFVAACDRDVLALNPICGRLAAKPGRRWPPWEAQILVLAEQYAARITGQRGAKMSSSQAGQEVIKRAGNHYDSLVLDGFTKIFGGQVAGARAPEPCALRCGRSQSFPHLDDPRLQVGSEFFIGSFRRLRFRWRQDWVPKNHFQRLESMECLVARPRVVESLNCHGHDRYLQVDRKNGRAFLEDSGYAIDRALAFRVEHERQPCRAGRTRRARMAGTRFASGSSTTT